MDISTDQRRHAQDLLDFIDQSPSPWHAVDTLAQRLRTEGFSELDEREDWALRPGVRHFVIRGGSSLIAFRVGETSPAKGGFRLIGAHTDSPGLRLKPQGAHGAELLRLGVDVYGGPLLATFADRDLSLAGRVCLRGRAGIEQRLIRFDRPLLRLPNLAIHMNRKVNDEGLKFNKQTELPLIIGAIQASLGAQERFREWLARQADCAVDDLLSFELNVYDTQKGAFWGAEGEFLADSQIDNLSSCHAGLIALMGASTAVPQTQVAAFFDHEEIGSESHKGADGSFLGDVLERLAVGLGDDRNGFRRGLARSLMVSADAAHAFNPNFPHAYEPLHSVQVNGGPAVKINVNQRYATDAPTEALFKELCRQAGVPGQLYVHRSDLGCGSTIGPMTAARLGIPTLDCGTPMWAMHSVRESAGVLDQGWFADLLRTFLATTDPL